MRFADKARHVGRFRDIALDRNGLASERPNLAGDLLGGAPTIEKIDGDVGAFVRQRQDGGLADALLGAGHERAFAGKKHGGPPGA